MSTEKSGNFKFAYNNVKFSDRLLRIEITVDSNEVSGSSFVDRKHKREDSNNHTNVDSNKNLSETNYEDDKHEEALVLAEQKSQSGGENENENKTCGLTNSPSVLSVTEIYVCSTILAAKSQFFFKLFSNGMLESEQKHITLKIDASEENAVMDLLKFIYNYPLSLKTIPELLNVLVVADKFEVVSCVKYCIRLLLKTPMTRDFALLVLHLPLSLLMADSVNELKYAARQFISFRYKNISKIPMEELMALPLVAMETILASYSVEIESEDVLYDLVLKWAKSHYSVLEERQEILGSHLARYIRFPYMTCDRLKNILTSDDFTPSMASKLVVEALVFKAESVDKRRILANGSQGLDSIHHWLVERAYTLRPIRIVELESPKQRCIVYMDLKREECQNMYPSGCILSQTFHLGGLGFSLSPQCCYTMYPCFGLFLQTQENVSASLTVDCEFSVRRKTTEEFEKRFRGIYKVTGGTTIGCPNLFIPWDSFIAKQCPYFINDVLHLRADLSICLKNQPLHIT